VSREGTTTTPTPAEAIAKRAIADDAVAPGAARLSVERVSGESAVVAAYATSPMKLLVPVARGRSVWAFLSALGGGVVAGDQTRLEADVGAGARCHVGTQASTKVYRNPGLRPSGHSTCARVGAGALLSVVPDPVQAFAGAVYDQRQRFELSSGAGLVLVDAYSAGRFAMGERWAFARVSSRIEVWMNGQRALLDNSVLSSADGPLDGPHRMGRFNALALILVMGDLLRAEAAEALEATRSASARPRGRTRLAQSASPVRGGVLIRVAGEEAEEVARLTRERLGFLPSRLGDDPWGRRA
jgi:urease accessory protein